MWKKIALLFALLCTSYFSFGAEFDPAACPDLSVKIFPGNNKQYAENSQKCEYTF